MKSNFEFLGRYWPALAEIGKTAEPFMLLVKEPDVDYDSLRPGMVAADVVFNRPETPFLQEAARRGLKTITGLGMLVNQAALNFRLWTGAEPPVEVMTEALAKEFGLNP